MKLRPYIENLKSENFGFIYFIAGSITLHFLLFGFLILGTHFEAAKNKPEILEISFTNFAPEKQKNINPTTLVDSDSENANNELSENTKFLSEKNNTVKKETRAKTGNKFHNARKSSEKLKAQKAAKNNKPKLFGNEFDAYASINKREAFEQKQQSGNGSAEASMTNDNLAKIENDLMTRLNTKEYKYFSYYSRIKKQLNQWWVPKIQQKFTKMLSQGRTLASEENKITKLVIILNQEGNLVAVQVLAESGVRDLDDAAVEAFRAAAPFPNPPKGMIENDGTVKIRWDCVVES